MTALNAVLLRISVQIFKQISLSEMHKSILMSPFCRKQSAFGQVCNTIPNHDDQNLSFLPRVIDDNLRSLLSQIKPFLFFAPKWLLFVTRNQQIAFVSVIVMICRVICSSSKLQIHCFFGKIIKAFQECLISIFYQIDNKTFAVKAQFVDP